MTKVFEIRIDMGNEAFAEYPHAEIAQILRGLAADLDTGILWSPQLHDTNGNAVGRARFLEETGTAMTIISDGDFAFLPKAVAADLKARCIVYYCNKCDAYHLCDGHGWSEIPGMEGP